MSAQVTIYALCDDSGVRYVGQTRQDLARRLAGHYNEARRGTSAKDQWFRAVLASGQTPTIQALEATTNEGADEREKEWIAVMRRQGQAILNDSSRRRAHGRQRRKGPDPAWSHLTSVPAQWRPHISALAEDNGVPMSVMLRLLVHAGLEHWEARKEHRLCRAE